METIIELMRAIREANKKMESELIKKADRIRSKIKEDTCHDFTPIRLSDRMDWPSSL